MYNKFSQFGKDWEEGVNFERLRKERLQKTREAMGRHGLQAMVVFAPANTRYNRGFLFTVKKFFIQDGYPQGAARAPRF